MSRPSWARPDRVISDRLLADARQQEPTPASEDPPVWTLGMIKQAARLAASRCRYPESSLCDDPVRLAESGVGLAVAIDPGVSFYDAVFAGQNEIFNAARQVRRDRGQSGADSYMPAPNFYRYWAIEQPRPPTCVEQPITLRQVLTGLTPAHLDTLLLLAFTDTTAAAAEAAGLTHSGFLQRARAARQAALALWFDGETPPHIRRLPPYRRKTDRVCREGHPITGDNIRWETSATGRRHARCKACRVAADQKRRSRLTGAA